MSADHQPYSLADVRRLLRAARYAHLSADELAGYHERRLDPLTRARVTAHLRRCLICERALAMQGVRPTRSAAVSLLATEGERVREVVDVDVAPPRSGAASHVDPRQTGGEASPDPPTLAQALSAPDSLSSRAGVETDEAGVTAEDVDHVRALLGQQLPPQRE